MYNNLDKMLIGVTYHIKALSPLLRECVSYFSVKGKDCYRNPQTTDNKTKQSRVICGQRETRSDNMKSSVL